jgi:hypothetical protein
LKESNKISNAYSTDPVILPDIFIHMQSKTLKGYLSKIIGKIIT